MINLSEIQKDSLTTPPDGYMAFDTFARAHHTRTPSILNYLNKIGGAKKDHFGDIKPCIDKTGGVALFVSPEQQKFLLENYPQFHLDFAPKGFLSVTNYARNHQLAKPTLEVAISGLSGSIAKAFGEVYAFKTIKGNIASYLSPKQQEILDKVISIQ